MLGPELLPRKIAHQRRSIRGNFLIDQLANQDRVGRPGTNHVAALVVKMPDMDSPSSAKRTDGCGRWARAWLDRNEYRREWSKRNSENYQKFFGPQLGTSSSSYFEQGLNSKAIAHLKETGALQAS